MAATWDITLWLDDIETFDYAEYGYPRLPWQYRGEQPRLQAIQESLLDRLQSLEDVAINVMANRWPLTAIGVQLDTCGKIVGQARGEMTDDEYRVFIIAKILVNKSKGRASEIGEILDLMGFTSIDMRGARGELIVAASGDYGEIVGPFVAQALPAGVRFAWVFTDEDYDDTFRFSDTLSTREVDADSGFGPISTAAQTSGGFWARGMML